MHRQGRVSTSQMTGGSKKLVLRNFVPFSTLPHTKSKKFLYFGLHQSAAYNKNWKTVDPNTPSSAVEAFTWLLFQQQNEEKEKERSRKKHSNDTRKTRGPDWPFIPTVLPVIMYLQLELFGLQVLDKMI